jgi:membrane-associated phospholipid phosphatase
MKKISIILLFCTYIVNAQIAVVKNDKKENIIGSNTKTLPTKNDDNVKTEDRPQLNITVPLAVIGTGMLFISSSAHRAQTEWHQKNFRNFSTSIDDYLAITPNGLVFAIDLVGIKAKNNFKDRLLISAISNAMAMAMVNGLKYTTNITRPDGSTNNSFPSGHTAFAFTGSEIMYQEYKDSKGGLPITLLGYTIGGVTGSLRMMNNRHWFSDVVFGAGVGMLSTRLAYRLMPWVKKKLLKNENLSVLPIYLSNGGGVGLAYTF